MRDPEAENVIFDRHKFKNVVHYICESCKKEELGKVKLHKILYFSDMFYFNSTGKPLTGVEYRKQSFGPCATHLGSALDELSRAGSISITKRDVFGFVKFDFESLVHANRSGLSNSELAVLDAVIEFVCARSTKEISEISHDEPWQLAEMGETIPYFTAVSLQPREVTEDDIAWGRGEAKRLLDAA